MIMLLVFAGVAVAASLVFTPLICKVAGRWQLTDRPDGHRKLHGKAIPLGGGVAVFAALVLAMAVAWFTPGQWQSELAATGSPMLGLLAAGIVIVLVGLADDRFGLRGRQKLLGQIVAAAILISSGFMIQQVRVFDLYIDLGLMAVPFTMFWMLGAINSVNLIDGVDGLAGTVGLILSLTVGAMALVTGHDGSALVAICFAGALAGFLCFNLPPARIFLGDAGSMLIGLIVGALAIRASIKGPATVAMAAPLAAWAIPIFDSSAAIIRRKLTGRSIYTTDRGHLHHCVLDMFGSNLQTVGWIAVCCVVTCAGALLSTYLQNDSMALISAVSVVAILIATRVFGHVELQLLAGRLKSVGMSLITPAGRGRGHTRQAAIRLQGTRKWDTLWSALTEFADKLNLHSIRLDINLPAVHEGFHGLWRRQHHRNPDDLWRTEIPLFSGDRLVGRLTASGERDGVSSCELIERLMDLLQPFESGFVELARVAAPADAASNGHAMPLPVERVITANPGNVA